MSIVVGVDTGGTFTDLLMLDREAGAVRVAKVPTTPDDQSRGFLAGLGALGVGTDAIELLVHATTVGTNAMLERRGAACGLITTRGFRDVLELGRRTRPHAYGLSGGFEALIERQHRLEVTERIDVDGDVVVPLDEDELVRGVRRLAETGVESLIIHFINAYINPAHERRAAELARAVWPNDSVVCGSEILREIREFERGTAAAINGYIGPVVSRYLNRVEGGIRDGGFRGDFLVMQGNGGMASAAQTGRYAINTVMSGPAAGAIAAGLIGERAGWPNLISCDMGGTSFDVTLIVDGRPSVSSERDITYGVPIRVPMVDVHTISSGGGSIARIDKAGMLRVGPGSAGSAPGPICYGRGGLRPTITDANLVLGRLNPASINAEADRPSREAVEQAIAAAIGVPLGLDGARAAAAIVEVAVSDMAGAINLVSVARGYDPRDFVMFAFGGAGPLHAVALARELGIPKVLVPPYPGITSAIGSVLADVRHDLVLTVNQDFASVSEADTWRLLCEQAEAGHRFVASQNIPLVGATVEHAADFLYDGQSHVLRIVLPGEGFDKEQVLALFRDAYRGRFGIDLSDMRLILANLRTTVVGHRDRCDVALIAPAAAAQAAGTERTGSIASYFEGAWHDTAIYDRARLVTGTDYCGPCIVEQPDTTTYVDTRSSFVIDPFGNMIITVRP